MFKLSKWYLDAVTDEGAAFIGYAARLHWGALRVSYRAALHAVPGAPAEDRVTIRSTPDPWQEAGGELRWRCAPLGIDGRWRPLAPPVARRLFVDGDGAVDWECRVPAARVELLLPSGKLAGLGYAERLVLTVPPWRLPIDTLRWGRFVSPHAGVVWIDWSGPSPQQLILVDGIERRDARLEPERIVTATGETLLALGDGTTLRRGPIFAALAAAPALAQRLPRWFGQGHEDKRLSRAVCSRGNGSAALPGWAIHEVVEWRSNVAA